MTARTGEEYLSTLKTPRSVWVNGVRLSDVTSHPGFKGSLAGMAGYGEPQDSIIVSGSRILATPAEADFDDVTLKPLLAQRQQDWQNVPEFWAATDRITGQYNIGR